MIAIRIKSEVYGEKYFFIDGEDFRKIKHYKWFLSYDKNINNFYLRANFYNDKNKRTSIKIHRLIMDAKSGEIVDHINHDTLDNRKENLRICTNQQNNMNSRKYKNGKDSKYKGVNLTHYGIYQARIRFNGKSIYIGVFKNEIEAARAYNNKAKELFKEFANLNIIEGE